MISLNNIGSISPAQKNASYYQNQKGETGPPSIIFKQQLQSSIQNVNEGPHPPPAGGTQLPREDQESAYQSKKSTTQLVAQGLNGRSPLIGTRLGKFIMAAKGQSQQPQLAYENNLVEDFELMKNVQCLIEENAHRCQTNNLSQPQASSKVLQVDNHYLPNQITSDDSFRMRSYVRQSEVLSNNLFSQDLGFEPIKHLSSGRLNQKLHNNPQPILESAGLFQVNHQILNPPPPRKTNVFRLINNNNNKYARIRNEIDQMLNQHHQRYQSASPQQFQQNIFDERNQYVHEYLNDNLFAQQGRTNNKDPNKSQVEALGRILRFSQENQIRGEQISPQKNPVISLKKQKEDSLFDQTNQEDQSFFQVKTDLTPSLFDVSSNKLFDLQDPQIKIMDAQGLLHIQKQKHLKSMQHQQKLNFQKKNPQALYLQINRQKNNRIQDSGTSQNLQLVGNQFQTKINPEQYIVQGIEQRRISNESQIANQLLGKDFLTILKRRQIEGNKGTEDNVGYQGDESLLMDDLDKSGIQAKNNNDIQLLRESIKLDQKEDSRQAMVTQQKSERIFNSQRPRKYVQIQQQSNHGQSIKKTAHNTFSSREQRTLINQLKQSNNNSTYQSRSKLKTLIENNNTMTKGGVTTSDPNGVTPSTTSTTGDQTLLSTVQNDGPTAATTAGEINKRGSTNRIIKQQKKINLAYQQMQIETEEEKIERILKFQKQIKAKYNDISLSQNIKDEPYRFIIVRGNNSELVKRCLEDRAGDWQEISSKNTLFNFKWSPFSKGIRFDYLTGHGMKKMVNHFEFHDQISEKDNLFINMQKLCENQKKNVFSVLPVTFSIDLSSKLASEELERFQAYFNILEKHKSESSREERLAQVNKEILANHLFNSKMKTYTKYTQCENMFDGNNLWLLKPTDYNRGRGVQVFNSLEQLSRLVQELQQGMEVKFLPNQQNRQDSKNLIKSPDLNQSKKMPLPPIQGSQQCSNNSGEQVLTNFTNLESVPNIVKTNDIVIQKYLERPLLIRKRKFDIRLWVLVTHEYKCYLFKEGYIRTSSFEYDTSPDSLDKPFIHLTNNAVQKYNENYGAHEEGNQLSLQSGTSMLKEDGIECDLPAMVHGQIVEIIKDSLRSIEGKLNPANRKFCMEIFGYDFIIDKNLNPWLIEVNTNPCLEESSSLLKVLIPRMVDDALKLTLDQVFPPKKQPKAQTEKQQISSPIKEDEPPLNLIIWSEPGHGSAPSNQFEDSKNPKATIHSIFKQEVEPSLKVDPYKVQPLPVFIQKSDPQATLSTVQQLSKYTVPGYSDLENMWNLIYQFKV